MTKNLRVALVCDWLTEVGGAERVLLRLSQMFPDAPIYTSQYRPKQIDWFLDKDVKTGWLNWLPSGLRKFMAPLRAIYFNHLTIKGFDLVIVVCNAEVKGVKVSSGCRQISYLQGPPTQYYWGMYDYYMNNPGFGRLNFIARVGLKLLLRPMRKSDYKSSRVPDVLFANSTYSAQEISKYYGRSAEVIYPPVDVAQIKLEANRVDHKEIKSTKDELFGGKDFLVVAGRQVNWKRFDLAVESCIAQKENLLVIGDGPEHDKLVELARGHANIVFEPKYDGVGAIVKYFRSAKGFIFPSLEPFGIVLVEALASGLPAIALSSGGANDIVQSGVSGVFFDEQTIDSLSAGLDKFNKTKFNRQSIAESVERFDVSKFQVEIKRAVDNDQK